MKKNIIMTILIAVTAVAMIIGILWHVTGTIHPGRGKSIVEAAGEVKETILEKGDDAKKEIKEEVKQEVKGVKKEVKDAVKGKSSAEAEEETSESAEEAASSSAEEVASSSAAEAASDSAEKTASSSVAEATSDSAEKTASSSAEEAVSDSEITSLYIDMKIGDITIREGEALKIDYSGDKKYEPEVKQDGTSLTIIQPEVHRVFNLKSLNINLTVTLPEENALSELEILEDLGDIEVSGLTAKELTIDNDLGNIDCTDCDFENATVVSNLGDVNIENCTFEDMDVQEDLGDVEISTPQDLSDSNLDLKTDLGDVKVDGEKQGTRHTRNGSGGIRLVVKNDMGDITLESNAS